MLTAAGVLGVFAVLPHPLEHLAQFFGTGVLIAIAAATGAWFAARAGLVTPIIDAALTGQPFVARARSVAVFAIVVEAKDAAASAFYEGFGFRLFPLRPQRLFLLTATAAAAFEKI